MKVRTLIVGLVAAVVSVVGLGGVASAAPAEGEKPPAAERCQEALRRLDEFQGQIQSRLERAQKLLAKAQEKGDPEAVAKAQTHIQKLQERAAKVNERGQRLRDRCSQAQA